MQDADFEKMADTVRNWNRWGPEDGRGTLNHVSAETLMRAAGTITQGKMFNLGLRFDRNGPQHGDFRFNPKLYVTALNGMTNPERPRSRYNDDVIHMPLQCATQWDALSHAHYDGILYNNCAACDTVSSAGASRNGVENLAEPGIMSRGVLLDIARLKGVDILPVDYAITAADLDEAAEREGVSIETGDIVLVRTGWMRHFSVDNDRAKYEGFQPGLDPECALWLYDKSAAAVASDNSAVEVMNMETITGPMPIPFHMLTLRDMGMPLGELWQLEGLAADCAADGRYSFMLSAPPLGVTGAFGSPVNPMALK
jgi:kynurenine formamidase